MKLLTKTIRSYLFYSVIVLLISMPVFYIVIEKLFINDVDEALNLRKSEVLKKITQIKSPADALVWGDLDNEIDILPASCLMTDSIYQEVGYDALKKEPEPYRTLSTGFLLQGKPYQLIIRISLVESEDLIESIALTQGILLLVLLSGLLLINRRLSQKIWKPFYGSLSGLQVFDIDQQNPILLPPSDIKEFSDLNQSIARLIHNNQEAYRNQKEFTDMAAHEMQTPLAVLKSELEVLVQSEEITPGQAASLEVFSGATMRLQRLNKSLLTLARIENRHYPETSVLEVNELITMLLDQYGDQIAASGILVKFSQDSVLKLQANRTLIEILLRNLISNAIRHNIPGGTISIQLDADRLIIENTGKTLDIPPEKLFQRFVKDSDDASSLGLGLSIVQKICETYRYRVQYLHEDAWHRILLTFQPQAD